MKQSSSLPGLTLFTLAFASAPVQTPATPAQPEPTARVALGSGKVPVGDGTFEDQADRSQ